MSADTVKLIANDGREFIVDRKAALISGTIKSMLSGPGNFAEASSGEIRFDEISGDILERVCAYLYYKLKYSNSSTDFPDFTISPESAMALLMAANFLDV